MTTRTPLLCRLLLCWLGCLTAACSSYTHCKITHDFDKLGGVERWRSPEIALDVQEGRGSLAIQFAAYRPPETPEFSYVMTVTYRGDQWISAYKPPEKALAVSIDGSATTELEASRIDFDVAQQTCGHSAKCGPDMLRETVTFSIDDAMLQSLSKDGSVMLRLRGQRQTVAASLPDAGKQCARNFWSAVHHTTTEEKPVRKPANEEPPESSRHPLQQPLHGDDPYQGF